MTEDEDMHYKLDKILADAVSRIEEKWNRKVKYFTVGQVCKILSVTRRTLQNYRDDKIIKFSQVGKKIWFKSTDVDKFIDSKLIK